MVGRFRFVFIKFPVLALTCLALASCGGAEPDTHAGQPVTKRKQVFKQMLRSFEPMGLTVRGREPYSKEEFLSQAMELQKLSTQPWDYFTADSNYKPTRAKADVWQKPAEFKQAQLKFIDMAEQLSKTAQGGDLESIRRDFGKVEESCKACHQQFRAAK